MNSKPAAGRRIIISHVDVQDVFRYRICCEYKCIVMGLYLKRRGNIYLDTGSIVNGEGFVSKT